MKNKHELRIKLMTLLYQQDIIKDRPLNLDDETGAIFLEINQCLAEIDDVIIANLANYTIDRLSFVDRAIIRLAVYEMLKTETPKPVIINEAIILTKDYSNLDDQKQSAFTNKLLDNISKRIG